MLLGGLALLLAAASAQAQRPFSVIQPDPGGMPFQAMPALGGPYVSRGYFQGRFRDRKLTALQAEYRSPLFWRLGGAAFVGAGQVAHRIRELRIDDFHYNAGVGVRYALVKQERINLRIDFGVGSDQTGIYAGVGEVF